MDSLINWLNLNAVDLAMDLFNANKRVYWLYLLASLALGLGVLIIKAYQADKTKPLTGCIAAVFNLKIWWHQSARADYKLILINRLIKAAFVTPFLFASFPIAIFIYDSFSGLKGPANLVSHSNLQLFYFTLILFLLDDFTRFALHYALHKVPALWRFHQIHHSAQVLTPLTVFRTHPVESALYAMRMTLVQGIAVGVGMLMFGPGLSMLDILGANLFIFAFNILGANLRHSHIWLSWGKRIEYIFISPAQHQLHHSHNPAHFDCNFGSCLAVWDICAKSHIFAPKTKPFKLKFGCELLGDEKKTITHPHSLKVLYFSPFYPVYSRLIKLKVAFVHYSKSKMVSAFAYKKAR